MYKLNYQKISKANSIIKKTYLFKNNVGFGQEWLRGFLDNILYK